ncbi:MAG: DegT/DnrJ/EryC1/StrS family aminotransferase [Gammaproteobacteria bacterium]|nr:DegT/DnrJ/EryC1/StrS family aminotransferase [Gammaproteobacteria bacterium]MCF6261487.1 DegT/DnrJ/EryC1/StrS family aminotransferase [Gammaproteobacteria bacterium]
MSDNVQMKVSHSFPGYSEGVVEAATCALQDGCFSGDQLKVEVEARLASFTHAGYAQVTGSGFAALQAALVAAGVRAAEKVIVPVVTCPGVYHAVRSLGAEPMLMDVGTELPLLDADRFTADMAGARFVIAPHMFGLSVDLFPLHERDLIIIEDCAQRQRPERDPLAVASVYSFSPTKLQTMGYGGGVVTDNATVHNRIQCFLSPDEAEQGGAVDDLPFRIHAPVADFQCAMLLAQLDRYQDTIARRQVWVEEYDKQLGDLQRLQTEVPFRYLLRLPEGRSAPELAQALQQCGVSAWPLGSQLLHHTLKLPGDYPNAERWQQQLLSLPLHEGLDQTSVNHVCHQLLALL